jgi:hypothetical protein
MVIQCMTLKKFYSPNDNVIYLEKDSALFLIFLHILILMMKIEIVLPFSIYSCRVG